MEKEIFFEHYRYRHQITLPQRFIRHTHHFHEIIYFFSGEVSYVMETQRYRPSPGDILIIPAACQHYTVVEGDAPYERAVIDFSGEVADAELVERIFSGVGIYHTAKNPAFADYFRRLDSYAEIPRRDDRERIARALLTELLCLIAGLCPARCAPAVKQDTAVESILQYIEANLTTIRSMDDICKALYISPSHLCKAFQETLGISPMKHVRQRRLQRAHAMLQSGERPTSIYMECGFRDYSTFYRAYREYFGVSPAEQPR